MDKKASDEGRVLIVVSIMIALIIFMFIVVFYANNKEENEKKSLKIQKKPEIGNIEKNNEKLNTNSPSKTPNLFSTDKVLEIKYQYFANLIDVAKVQEVKDLTFSKKPSGEVKVSYQDNSYLMVASFENLPDLKDGSFYNGWLLKEGDDFKIINTKKALKLAGAYMNSYNSEKDLTDYNIYLLSIEEDNSVKKPSSNLILRGEIKAVKK